MFLLYILVFTWNLVEIKPQTHSQTKVMKQVIHEFISASTGANLYFCGKKDAESILRYYSNGAHAVNSHLLQSVRSTQDMQVSLQQPQVQQVFVDLSCQQGLSLLQQSQQLFNSSYRWLLWTQDYKRTLKQLHRCRVLLDSSVSLALFTANSVTVYDLYKMHRSLPFTVTPVKHWSAAGVAYPLQVPRPRRNFNGANIKCSVVIRELDYDVENIRELLMDPTYHPGVDAKRRFNLRLLFHIAEYYNFTTTLIYTKTWGYPSKNGTYDGLIGQIQSGEAEISAVYTLFFSYRTKVVDYYASISFAKLAFVFLQPRTVGTYKALIVPLAPPTWGILLVIVTVSFLLMNIKKLSQGSRSDNLMVIVSTISHQGAPESIESTAGKLFFFTILIFAFLLFQYFNIAILSGLILPAPSAIQNWDQLIKSDLQLGVEDDTFLNSDIKSGDSKSEQVRNKLAKTKSKVHFPYDEGLAKIRKGGFALYSYALDHYGKLQTTLTDSEICSITEIAKVKGHIGPIGEKNGPYKESFRRIFFLFEENGVISSQRNFWVPSKPICLWRKEKVVISAKTLTVAFLVFVVGFIASIIIGFFEIYLCKNNTNQRPFLH